MHVMPFIHLAQLRFFGLIFYRGRMDGLDGLDGCN